MSIKAQLHDYHPAAAKAVPPAARAVMPVEARPAAAVAVLILAALITAVAVRPVRTSIGGVSHVFPRGTTAGAALAALAPEPADLLDVTGRVLRRGGGAPAQLLRRDGPVPLGQRLRRGDNLALVRGRDVVEPLRESATLLPPSTISLPGYADAALAGARRVQVGMLSGATTVELSYALPTVPKPAIASNNKLVALTFDDGPWPRQTAQIMSILKQYNARATFFVLGKLARAHPDLIRQAADQGCELGIHSWNHANLARQSAAFVAGDMAKCQAELQKLSDSPVRLMRPPYGALSRTAAAAIRGSGLRIILWSVDTHDWRRPGSSAIYSSIMRGARSGAIILCHDGGGSRTGTIAAVARAVPDLQKKGYKLVTVSELLGLHPLPEGGAMIADGWRLESAPPEPPVPVYLDGKILPLVETPLEIEGQLLLPIKPVLEELGVEWKWSQKELKLTIEGSLETVILRLNSTSLQRPDGSEETLPTPPVLYRSNLMIPLWVALQVAQATAEYDPEDGALKLISLEGSIKLGKVRVGAPANWGAGVAWQEYLRAAQ